MPDATATCFRHPESAASASCRRCKKTACRECIVITTNGTFCSQECFAAYQIEKPETQRTKGTYKKFVLIFLAVIIFVCVACAIIIFIIQMKKKRSPTAGLPTVTASITERGRASYHTGMMNILDRAEFIECGTSKR